MKSLNSEITIDTWRYGETTRKRFIRNKIESTYLFLHIFLHIWYHKMAFETLEALHLNTGYSLFPIWSIIHSLQISYFFNCTTIVTGVPEWHPRLVRENLSSAHFGIRKCVPRAWLWMVYCFYKGDWINII